MITFYVDIYFLLNFIVDIIAMHFAAAFIKLKVSVFRLFVLSALLSLYAVFSVLFDFGFLSVPISVACILMIGFVSARQSALNRKIKMSVAFLVFQTLLGGLVYLGYCTLARFFESGDFKVENQVNRKLIIIALFVLLAILVIKIIFLIFANTRQQSNLTVECEFCGKTHIFSAFVDSGNLAIDPLDGTSVMFVTPKLFQKIFGFSHHTMSTPEKLGYEIKKKIRVIPIRKMNGSEIIVGVKINEVCFVVDEKRERLSVIIAASEENSYGGHLALVSSSLLDMF